MERAGKFVALVALTGAWAMVGCAPSAEQAAEPSPPAANTAAEPTASAPATEAGMSTAVLNAKGMS